MKRLTLVFVLIGLITTACTSAQKSPGRPTTWDLRSDLMPHGRAH